MFNSVGRLIKDISTRSRSPGAIVALQVRQVARGVIDRECRDLSSAVTDLIKPVSFKAGDLTISVNSPLVRAELVMRADGLIDEINRALGKKLVRKLRFRLK